MAMDQKKKNQGQDVMSNEPICELQL